MPINILRRHCLLAIVVLCFAAPPTAYAVITAMLDTGIDQNTLTGITVPGFDFIDNDPIPEDKSHNNHGTQMSVIFNSVAPGEQIMHLKVFGTFSLSRSNAALNRVINDSKVEVIELSYLQPVDGNLLIKAAKNDKVIVINAGNKGGPSPRDTARLVPTLGGGGIIAGSLTSRGRISASTNKAGDLREHYITALGTSPISSSFGSSFSAARVSAGAASIKTRDPHLSNSQIVEILLRTATDLGAPGVDTVYGHGRLNLSKALSAQGDSSLATGSDSGSGGGAAIVGGALLVGAGALALFKKNKNLETALILDEYGRSFHINLDKSVTRRNEITSMTSLFSSLNGKSESMVLSRSPESSLFAVVNVDGASNRAFRENKIFSDASDYEEQNFGVSFHSYEKSGNQHSMGLNASQKGYFGALSLLPDSQETTRFLYSESFTAPFMGFTDKGISSASKLQYGQNFAMKFGLSAVDDNKRYGMSSKSVFFESSYTTDKWGLSFQLGQLVENGNLYGGASGGAFSVDSATTLSVGFSGEYNLSAKSSLIGSYIIGFTDVDDRENSLLHNFSTLRSNSWGLGYITNSLWKKGDALGVAYFQPLRVSGGEVDTDVPFERDIPGNIFKHHDRFSLVPDGRESVVEMYYKFNPGKRSEIASHLLYRDQPYHDRDASAVKAVMLTYQRYNR